MLVASVTTKRQFGTTGCLLGKLICMKCMTVPDHRFWIVQKENLEFLIIVVVSVNSFLFGRSTSESKGLTLYNGNGTLTDVVSATSYTSVYRLHFLVYYLELC